MDVRKRFVDLQTNTGFQSSRERLQYDVCNSSTKFFINSFSHSKNKVSTKDEFEKLTINQQSILKQVYGITTFTDSLQNIASHRERIMSAYEKLIKELSENRNPQTKIELYDSAVKEQKSMELYKQLFYFCFFAAIAYEDESTIRDLLPYDRNVYTSQDNICYFKNYSNIPFIFAQKSLHPSFFLFVDHIGQNIILSVRGLDGLQETVTFTLAEEDSLQAALKANANLFYTCHQAYEQAANNIQKDVEEQLVKFATRYPHYSMKLTGHSYGAGVAAILTWKLNTKIKLEKIAIRTPIRAVLFGCPPIFDNDLAKETCPFIVSVVFGWDMIPSLSNATILKFATGITNTEYAKERSLLEKKMVETKYQPGTIYWLPYDDRTGKANGIYVIPKTNGRLHTLMINGSMEADHKIQKTYAYLLASTQMLNASLSS